MATPFRNGGFDTICLFLHGLAVNVSQTVLRFLPVLMIGCSVVAVLDGITIQEPETGIGRTRQIVVVRREASLTTMMISTNYSGYGDSVAWFVPIPPDAELLSVRGNEPGALDFISYLNGQTGPLVEIDDEGACRMLVPPDSPTGELALPVNEVWHRLFPSADPVGLQQWSRNHNIEIDDSSIEYLTTLEPGWKILAVFIETGGLPVPSGRWIPPVTVRYRSGRYVYAPAVAHTGIEDGAELTLFSIGRSTVRSTDPVSRPIRYRAALYPYPPVEKQIEDIIDTKVEGISGGIAMLWSGSIQNDRYYDAYPRLDILANLDGEVGFLVTRLEGRSPGNWRPLELVKDSEPKDFQICFRRNWSMKSFSVNLIATPVFYQRIDRGSSFAVDFDIHFSRYLDQRQLRLVLGTWISLNTTDINNLTMLGLDLLLSRGVFVYFGASFCVAGENPDNSDPVGYLGVKGAIRPWFLRFESSSGLSWSIGLLQAAYYWNVYTSGNMWSLGLISVSIGSSI